MQSEHSIEEYMTEFKNKREQDFYSLYCKLFVKLLNEGHHKVLDSINLLKKGMTGRDRSNLNFTGGSLCLYDFFVKFLEKFFIGTDYHV